MNTFIAKYAQQYNAFLASDRIYYCLEERAIKHPGDPPRRYSLYIPSHPDTRHDKQPGDSPRLLIITSTLLLAVIFPWNIKQNKCHCSTLTYYSP